MKSNWILNQEDIHHRKIIEMLVLDISQIYIQTPINHLIKI